MKIGAQPGRPCTRQTVRSTHLPAGLEKLGKMGLVSCTAPLEQALCSLRLEEPRAGPEQPARSRWTACKWSSRV